MAPVVAVAVAGLCLLAGAAGCASYEPEPLNPVAVLEALNRVQLADALGVTEVDSSPTPRKIVLADGIGPEEAAWAAVALNPELREQLALRGMVAGDLLAAAAWPNPELDMEFRQALQANGKSLELSLGLEILRWEERRANRAQAEARQTAAQYDLLAAAEAVALEARQRWWQAVAARERVKLNAQELTLARQFWEHLRTKQQAGAATALEVHLAVLEKIQIELDGLRLREEQAAAERELRRVMGLPPNGEFALQIPEHPFATATEPPDYAASLPRLLDTPRLKAAEAEYRAAEGELRGAVARQYPGLRVGPSAAWEFDGSWSTLLGAVVSVELPIWNRNQGEIAARRASRDRHRAAYAARLHRLQAELAEACGASVSSRQTLVFIDREVLPAARESLRLAEAAYAAGNVDVLAIFKAQSAAATVNRQVLEAQIADRLLVESIRRVLGQPFHADWAARPLEGSTGGAGEAAPQPVDLRHEFPDLFPVAAEDN